MEIVVNGKPVGVAEAMSVAELLAERGVDPNHVVVEINRAIVPRDRYAEVFLQAGDTLEILRFVGGG